ncbi:PLDc N-terminal domain-containing protein [Pedobacter hiemivivus]|uniref:Cardiolipin synthase N-terminal domain-containing protein n=1 Tax=Pedobacter hiemivivus TaxID=2530454 RepID=A0A4R0MVX2_9SPHI|nr:hypothetical protein EZ444_20065 [Pedobacter hiemivivus]
MWYIIFFVLWISYMVYGIAHIVKNKSLNRAEKIIWGVIAICLPVLGVAIYLKTIFVDRH